MFSRYFVVLCLQIRTLAVLQPALCCLTPGLAAATAAAAAARSSRAAGGGAGSDSDEDDGGGGNAGGGTSGAADDGGGVKGRQWKRAVDAALDAVGGGRRGGGGLVDAWAVRVERLYDHARGYYGLLLGPQAGDLLQAAESKPMRYSFTEWVALLQV